MVPGLILPPGLLGSGVGPLTMVAGFTTFTDPESGVNDFHGYAVDGWLYDTGPYGSLSPVVTETGDTIRSLHRQITGGTGIDFRLQLLGNIAAGTKRLHIGATSATLASGFRNYVSAKNETVIVWSAGTFVNITSGSTYSVRITPT
jgi:hypothetical protein